MDVLYVEFENWYTLILRLNWLAIILPLIIVCIVYHALKKGLSKQSITIDELTLGIGDSKIKLKYDKRDQEIAYKLWVELSTRKIGLLFDRENDVITEVYDSWYEFFRIARELLKEIPARRLRFSNDLIDLTDKVLNKGLRPHLTTWQAKYRKWYRNASDSNKDDTPQSIQKTYQYYDELIEDLIKTNERMIEYKELMRKIAFQENS